MSQAVRLCVSGSQAVRLCVSGYVSQAMCFRLSGCVSAVHLKLCHLLEALVATFLSIAFAHVMCTFVTIAF